MKQTEYEMSESYQKAIGNLMKAIKERDDLLDYVNSRLFPPDVRNKKLRLIAQLTAQIDKFEQTLAKEYELTQKLRRAEAEKAKQDEDLAKIGEKVLPELLAHLAEHNPETHTKLVADLAKIDVES